MHACLLYLCISTLSSFTEQLPTPERTSYSLPAFDSLTQTQQRELRRYSTSEEYEQTRRDTRFRLEKVRYQSGGLKVIAYLYTPTQNRSRLLPAIIYNRGSYVAGDLAPAFAPLFRRLGQAGFVVLAPQYRGSDGGEGVDEMGGADVDDVMNATALAGALGQIDTTRLFMYGESRGGMMTYQAMRRGVAIRAAATVGAFTDLNAMVQADTNLLAVARQIWPDYDSNRDQLIETRSAVRWAEELKTPLLLLHGGADRQVSPKHSLALAERLQSLNRPYELQVWAGGSHTLGARSMERDDEVIAWFRRHLSNTP
jgi:dipeptidyl aminopeptidase/acylaminoacyl peptidase